MVESILNLRHSEQTVGDSGTRLQKSAGAKIVAV